MYEALDIERDEAVALKVIRSERIAHQGPSSVRGESDARAHAIRRFERESRAIGALATPHIVRLLEAGHDDERKIPFLVMELLRGKDLKQLLEEHGPLPPDVVVRIAAQAARGLVEAHAIGLVHRDIKPANIHVTETRPERSGERSETSGDEFVVKVLDFGVSKFQQGAPNADNHSSVSMSFDGGMIGSPAYMSPEQARGESDIDARTDVWSLGVVMYEMLSGRLPFGEKLPLGQVILAICAQPARPLAEVAPWVPDEICHVVERAIAKSRDARFASAAAFRDALIALCGDPTARVSVDMVRPVTETETSLHRVRVAPQHTATGDQAHLEGRHTATDTPRSQHGELSPSTESRVEFDSIRPVASAAGTLDEPFAHTRRSARRPRAVRWTGVVVVASALGAWFVSERLAATEVIQEPRMARAGAQAARLRDELALVVLPADDAERTPDTLGKRGPSSASAASATKKKPDAPVDNGKPAQREDVYAP